MNMTTPDQNMLPPTYQGLTASQALAKAFFKRTEEAIEAKMPLYALKGYIDDFTNATTVLGKQIALRNISMDLLNRPK
jgi:hypothetical protein